MALVGEHQGGKALIDFLLDQLAAFTGPDWEQEDDVTLVTLQRAAGHETNGVSSIATATPAYADPAPANGDPTWQVLGEWNVPSVPGNERQAMDQLVDAVRPLNLPPRRIEQLKTAVAEATMNAMEHGSHYRPELPVWIQVRASSNLLSVLIRDQGGNRPIPSPQAPDLEAKLAELQSPRGWGLFLIKNLVDDMRVTSDETHHTVELIVHLEGESHDGQNA
jgi:anti-sigma regulatory factor (Ser/Thr protein kinase)